MNTVKLYGYVRYRHVSYCLLHGQNITFFTVVRQLQCLIRCDTPIACRGRSDGSRSWRVDQRHVVSTPVMAAHNASSWYRF